MNIAAPAFAKPATQSLEPAFHIVGKLYGGLLGVEFVVLAGGKYFRCGEITLDQLKRGIDPHDLDLLECDCDGEIE